MSIALLTQVYDEARRLAIAGSNLAPGDFRLKKLIPPLEKAGKKAPVFGKVAQAATKLVEGPEKESAQALLDLSTLVNAVLYTQGETGAKGKLKSLDAVDMGPPVTGTGARVLKPLIEALTTTGSGRLEIINDAYERKAFRDIRLVNPALRAIDDPYGEIGDLIADKVLPTFGKTIYGEVRAGFDVKGRGGHVRRLRLLHRLDPQATDDLVEQALEEGSKELKIEALACLRDKPGSLPHLLEQAKAKAKDVRRAALQALGTSKNAEAVQVLIDALSGKDVDIAVGPASENPSPKLLKHLHESAADQFSEILETKAKAQRSKALARFHTFLGCFASRADKKTVDFLKSCFDQREKLFTLKGGDYDGEDIVWSVTRLLLLTRSKPVMKMLADSHAGLPAEILNCCFIAAAIVKTPKQVYDDFSPYLLATPTKKRGSDAVADRKQQIMESLFDARQSDVADDDYVDFQVHYDFRLRYSRIAAGVKLDPRWLDAAIDADELALAMALGRPKHKRLNDYLTTALAKKRQEVWELASIIEGMVAVGHPSLTESYVDVLKRLFKSKSRRQHYGGYWLARLIPDLPKSAVQPLEELVPTLPDKIADELIPYLTELKAKK